MTDINKQKFLAELGRLLTFMYEEDRQLALDMYEKMFDSCPDIHALMQILVSPTRQAVNIARVYDATDRKLQVYSSSREEDGVDYEDELPEFVLAIDQLYQTAADRGLMEDVSTASPVLENQISIFDDADVPGLFDVDEPAEEAPAAQELPESEAVEEKAEESLPMDEVDAFLASFSIDDSELVPSESAEEAASAEESPAEEEAIEEAVEEEPVQTELQVEEAAPVHKAKHGETIHKPRVFLLILYIIAAIPVTLAGIALLLIPTALVLALAAGVILAGSAAFAAAFGGFAVFADFIVVLGTALIVSAVGLILLWLFIWFIGGAIPGFISSVVRLGAKCCYKEVPAV